MPDPISGTIDYYGIRWNWGSETLEMNTGDETWVPVPGFGGSPAGSAKEIQYNDANDFGASAHFIWDESVTRMTISDGTDSILMTSRAGESDIQASGDMSISTSHTTGFWLQDNMSGADNIGLGTYSPDASAALDITSTVAGFLPPRMTAAQRDAISSPAEGLMVWNSDTHKINCWNGSAWKVVTFD